MKRFISLVAVALLFSSVASAGILRKAGHAGKRVAQKGGHVAKRTAQVAGKVAY